MKNVITSSATRHLDDIYAEGREVTPHVKNGNARLYDPAIGRFFSPDPFVQAPDFTQNYNRYSYCMNNPVMYSDEDGEYWHIIAGAIIGGAVNLYSNWDNIDNFLEGVTSFLVGAGSGALTAANPVLGSVVGPAVTEAHNEITKSTGQGNGFSKVAWGNVVGQSIVGAATGFLSYGAGSIIGQTGVATKLMDAIGLKNLPARNIIGSTINGSLSGTAIGFGTGLCENDGNLWQYTWRGAAFGGAGGLAYGLLTETGYQIQLKRGRNKYLDSDIIDGISNVGDIGINQLNNFEGGEVYGNYTLPEITVIAESATTATVYIQVSPNSPYIPPAPYKYSSPTLFRLIPLLRL